MLSTFFESGFDRALEHMDIDGLSQAIMGPARPLEGVHLLMNFQSAGNNHDRDKRQQLFQFRKEFQAEFAFIQHVVQNEQVGPGAWNLLERLAAGADANQFIFAQRLLVNLVLEIVVFNNHDGGNVHAWFRLEEKYK